MWWIWPVKTLWMKGRRRMRKSAWKNVSWQTSCLPPPPGLPGDQTLNVSWQPLTLAAETLWSQPPTTSRNLRNIFYFWTSHVNICILNSEVRGRPGDLTDAGQQFIWRVLLLIKNFPPVIIIPQLHQSVLIFLFFYVVNIYFLSRNCKKSPGYFFFFIRNVNSKTKNVGTSYNCDVPLRNGSTRIGTTFSSKFGTKYSGSITAPEL